ncbi:TetR/AcrR family transcriptional regulator [Kribbella sp. NPDC050459]|uniref:TetR/AcrR family transcriptional regulator n=1 Tax=Kribbella sp. NPDC050459 TaxID=3155785 RepID=UPI0033C36860
MGRPMSFDTDDVVDKAVEVFWRQGFGATTPQNLVDALGIGKGSLYNTFKSKHQLFQLAMRRYSELRLAELTEGLDGPGAVRPKLRRAVHGLAGISEHQRGCLVVNAVAELGTSTPEVAEVSKELFSRIEDRFEAAIERGRVSGELQADTEPRDAAGALLAAVIGTNVLTKTGRGPGHLSRLLDAALAAL